MKSISTLNFFFLQTIFMTNSIHFLSYDIASNLSIDSTISFSLIVIFRALQFTEDNYIMYWTLKILNFTWVWKLKRTYLIVSTSVYFSYFHFFSQEPQSEIQGTHPLQRGMRSEKAKYIGVLKISSF